MKVQELIDALSKLDKEKTVQIGCQGFTTKDDPSDEYNIRVLETKTDLFIVDGCGGYPIPGVGW